MAMTQLTAGDAVVYQQNTEICAPLVIMLTNQAGRA
jgi:hypothetical protein